MLTIKQINSNISYFKQHGAKIDARLHETGVAIMQHAQDHGDYTAVNRLLAVFPQSGRKQAFVLWFCDHTPFVQDAKSKEITRPKNPKKSFNITGATKTPFWEYSKETASKPLNIAELLVMAFKRIEDKKPVEHADLLPVELRETAKKLYDADKAARKQALEDGRRA